MESYEDSKFLGVLCLEALEVSSQVYILSSLQRINQRRAFSGTNHSARFIVGALSQIVEWKFVIYLESVQVSSTTRRVSFYWKNARPVKIVCRLEDEECRFNHFRLLKDGASRKLNESLRSEHAKPTRYWERLFGGKVVSENISKFAVPTKHLSTFKFILAVEEISSLVPDELGRTKIREVLGAHDLLDVGVRFGT